MPRKTQNAVFNADGTRFALTSDANSFATFLNLFNALRYVQGANSNGEPLFVDANGKATTENTGKPFLSARPRSGYTQYWNNDGFTDPISPDNLTPQGVGKLLAKLIEVSHTIIANGGDEATEMQTILNGALAFNGIAANFVAEKATTNAVENAIKVLTVANGGNVETAQAKLAEMVGSKVVTAEPTIEAEPIVEPTIEPTIVDKSDTIEVNVSETETGTIVATEEAVTA